MLEKTFAPQEIERRWYDFWERNGCFAPKGNGEPYTIMIPPPNVTGALHMGHAFQYALVDVLIRYQRMCGKKVLWQVGTDHAGIATQLLVERKLEREEQLSRHDLGREALITRINAWKKHSHQEITAQMRRLGIAVDWQRERFTLDVNFCHAVRQAFIQLYDQGLLYRGKRLVNWDPLLQTAISDLEVTATEEPANLYHVRYPLVDQSDSYIVIATTRPETILADGAVAVHPQDARYRDMVGRRVHVPCTSRVIPIIADDYVQMDFGSGCVKITPAHDFNDYAVGQRHAMEVINLFTPDARMNDNAPVAYRGLDRFVARKRIIEDLQRLGLVEKIEQHVHRPPRGQRSGTIIEPYLTDQWFVKIAALAQPAIAAVREKRIRFVPEQWENLYFSWMNEIQDWCISRQIWWGHRIPAWYDQQGNIYVAEDEVAARAKYRLPANLALYQDEDVLDTWFSSGLWTFATLGWPKDTPELQTFHPTSTLVTGFDIIFFWVARMIMLSLHLTGQIPFSQVYIHGLVRDAAGEKMSKSKGNVLDPIDLIHGINLDELLAKRTANLLKDDEARIQAQTQKEFPQGIAAYGTDALRFTFCAMAATGRDVHFSVPRIAGYRNFCNKLWNAARFVLMHCVGQDCGIGREHVLSLGDQWIYTRLQQTIAQLHQQIQEYRFDWAAQSLYTFVWDDFCDWYLEFSKPILSSSEMPSAQTATRHTLLQVLEQILRLAHPFIPFITEEIWQKVYPLTVFQTSRVSLMEADYPQVDQALINQDALTEISWVQQLVTTIRKLRSENHIPPANPIEVCLLRASAADRQMLERNRLWLEELIRGKRITSADALPGGQAVAIEICGSMELAVILEGVDLLSELQRLDKVLAKLRAGSEKLHHKLRNAAFLARAPQAIVDEQKAKYAKMQARMNRLQRQRDLLGGSQSV